ncbi:MAG TPA: prepilin-type N-terminal cleavage/methylation domain-containing protein [Patescibacteria group bacterium]|nr:prepilin-type N-terminal cleavage/methylation domain-containing protein [Patescibacteria group bacterium]
MTTAQLNFKKINSGFTLIELLVVIVILAILAMAVMLAINPAARINSAKDAKVQSDMGQIIDALNVFNTDGQSSAFPAASADLTAASTTVGTNSIVVKQELTVLPTDPAGSAYHYLACANATGNTNTTCGTACTDAAGTCSNAALYDTAYNQGANTVWCWRSATGSITAVASASTCTP